MLAEAVPMKDIQDRAIEIIARRSDAEGFVFRSVGMRRAEADGSDGASGN